MNEWIGNNDKIKITYQPIRLSEENIGTYETRKMMITALNQTVSLEPMGTLIIGAHGRIDLKGRKGSVGFILRKNSSTPDELEWKIIQKPSKNGYIDLNADTFSDALMSLLK